MVAEKNWSGKKNQLDENSRAIQTPSALSSGNLASVA